MKLHERTAIVQQIQNEMASAVLDVIKKHPDLTYPELFSCLNQIEASWIKYAIRDERHPGDPDARGDEA